MTVAGSPSQVFELVTEGDGCAVFLGLFTSKAQAQARAAKIKADEVAEFGEEMDTQSTISAVEVLDEHVE